MALILWIFAILEMMALVYIPCVCLYGLIRLMEAKSVEKTIRNPFFGLKEVSLKTGFLVWSIQSIYLGGIFMMLGSYHINGTQPLLFGMLNP